MKPEKREGHKVSPGYAFVPFVVNFVKLTQTSKRECWQAATGKWYA
jgi:hypothetical protein